MKIYYSKTIFRVECNATLDIPDVSIIINKILHGNRQQTPLRK